MANIVGPSSTQAIRPTRIAMWSPPRSMAAAMMRSFSSRADTIVVDEPLYAHYLVRTGDDHPARDEILASQPKDWRLVAESLIGPLPDGISVLFSKHMTHHLMPSIDLGWLSGFQHVYLVRDPARIAAAYVRAGQIPTLDDLGCARQVALFRRFPGPVIDADDVLLRPREALRQLCAGLGIEFDVAMLHWAKGPHPADGAWAAYRYGTVRRSMCFAPYDATPPNVPPELHDLVNEALPDYRRLCGYRK